MGSQLLPELTQPARGPQSLDKVLVQTEPGLQMSPWRRSFSQ